jgi:AAA15 family ATPase/GTPase
MLISFSFSNFLSFRKHAIIDLLAGAIKEKPENIHTSTLIGNVKILKSLGLYGANSSGKSNIIKAFDFFRNFALNSSKESSTTQKIQVNSFELSESSDDLPTTMEASFLINGSKYRFGFQVTKTGVQSEWLFVTVDRKEEQIFIRAKQGFSFNKKFRSEYSKARLDTLAEFTPSNSLYISVLAQFNIGIAQELSTYISRILIARDSDHSSLINATASLMIDEDYRRLINRIIKDVGIGIESVEEKLKEISQKSNYSIEFLSQIFEREIKSFDVKTKHLKYDEEFKKVIGNVYFDLIQNESLGTQKFYGLLGPILIALKENRTIIIDEIDARLHTLLLEYIINLFNSKLYNPNGAQLVFTSHNTNLLKNKLRRDQMLLVEKDKFGVSTIESLYKKLPKVRNDASFDKDYLTGKYGAIPTIVTQLNLFDK